MIRVESLDGPTTNEGVKKRRTIQQEGVTGIGYSFEKKTSLRSIRIQPEVLLIPFLVLLFVLQSHCLPPFIQHVL